MTNTTEKKSCCSGHRSPSESTASETTQSAPGESAAHADGVVPAVALQPAAQSTSIELQAPELVIHKDPVCGMTVNPSKANAQLNYQGVTYSFCCQGCATKFSTSPGNYLKPQASEASTESAIVQTAASCCGGKPVQMELRVEHASIATGTAGDYTCPMHPEVVNAGPGDCPDCGMPLEPMMPSAGDDGKTEIDEIFRRLSLTTAFAVPVAFLSMSHMLQMSSGAGLPHLVSCWLQFALATPVVAWLAKPFFERGVASVKNRSLNMFTLLSMGIGLPYLVSFVSLLWVTLTNQAGSEGHVVYFESAVVIAALAWIGQLLEAKARVRSSSAIRGLVALMPTEATVILHDGSETTVSIGDIAVGAKIKVRPGERIAVDGVTIDGTSSVNESMLTGEAMPVFKRAGTQVSAGTINGNGSLVIEAKRVGVETTLSQIVTLVSQAQRSRVPVQQLADRVASVFVPAVIAIALLTVLGWAIIGGDLVHGLSAALAVLVVACPCALGLATPMSIVVATGRAAKAGVLFKEARSLQLLAGVNTLVIDKTGTLTLGTPRLVSTKLAGDFNESEVVVLAASLESRSEHPLASAIVSASKEHGGVKPCRDFVSTPGGGVAGVVSGRHVAVGTPAYLQSFGADCSKLAETSGAVATTATTATPETISTTATTATTSVFVAVDGACQARLDFADEVRANVGDSIKELRQRGIKVIMATGDSEDAAKSVATALGITDYHARLLPSDKAALVQRLQAGGASVAMAGDGINDAASLVQANVGIAMASGTDIAMHSADIVLVNSEVQGIVRAQKVSVAMLRNIKQNLFLAFAYNLLTIPLAAGVLTGWLGFAVDPMVAAAAMSLSSVAVIVNALRLRGLKL